MLASSQYVSVTLVPGWAASNRFRTSSSTTFLLSWVAQWLHHVSSAAGAAVPDPADSAHASSPSQIVRLLIVPSV